MPIPDPPLTQSAQADTARCQTALERRNGRLPHQVIRAGAGRFTSAGERPTFHEIRALGAWLFEQQGFAQEHIQGLMGHADVKMTEHYQSGHGNEAVVYMKVKADLKL
nr:tyrosine-type recombinase/integrase [Pseudomonas yamanorum]